MTWNYRLTKQDYVDALGETSTLFGIREVFYEDHPDGARTIVGWTHDEVTFGGDNAEETIKALQMALADAQRYPVLDIGSRDRDPDIAAIAAADAAAVARMLATTPVDPDPQAFTVTLTQDRSTKVLLCTDDWLEAHAFVRNMTMPTNGLVSIKGVHPTHDFVTAQGEKRCHQCGAYGNGSYGSQAPCGFDFARKPLSHHIEAWIASRP